MMMMMMMIIAASLMWAGVAEKPEQSKMTLENLQNNSLGSLSAQTKFNQNKMKNIRFKLALVSQLGRLKNSCSHFKLILK